MSNRSAVAFASLVTTMLAAAGLGSIDAAPAQVPAVSWNRIALGAAGPDRALHTMIYDPANERFVVFGGIEADPGSNRFRNDVYTLDATDDTAQWQRVSLSGLEPPPIAYHTAIYDPVRQRMIVNGGMTDRDQFQSEDVLDGDVLWFLDLSDADSLVWSSETVTGNPIDRFAHAAVYVPTYDAMVITSGAESFGNLTTSSYALLLGETPMRWVRLANAGMNPRAGHAMIHDGGSRLIVYGGLTNFENTNPTRELVQLNIAGSLDGADRWTRLTTATPGLERAFMAAAFDVAAGLWWVQGGFQSGNSILNDLSVLDLKASSPTWTRTLEVSNGPGTRFGNPAALDPSRSRFVTEGGSPDNRNTRDDTYELVMTTGPTATPSATTDTTATSTGSPTATQTATPTSTATASTTTATSTSTIGPSPTRTATAGTATPTPTDAATAPPVDHTVDIRNLAFDPDPIEILVGETVRWINRDAFPHTTTSGSPGNPNGLWDSGFLTTNSFFDNRFFTAGTFSYYCTVHPQMVGRVIVVDPGAVRPIYLPITLNRDASLSPDATATPLATPREPAVVEPLGQLGGASRAVARVGDFVLAGMGGQLVSIDVSDESAPTIVNSKPLFGGLIQEIHLTDAGAWVGDSEGFGLFDVTDPADPSLLGATTLFAGHEIRVAGSVAIVANLNSTRSFDVSDPANISQLGVLQTGGVTALDLVGDRAYVVAFQTLRAIDISDPANLVELGSVALATSGQDVAAVGTTLYVAQSDATLRIMDATDPTALTELGQVGLPFGGAYSVQVVGNRAYVGNNFGQLAIVDVATAAQSQLLGVAAPAGASRARDVFVSADRVYVGYDDGGIRIFNTAIDAAPNEAASVPMFGSMWRVSRSNDLLGLSGLLSGLPAVVDVANPAAPSLASIVSGLDFSSAAVITGAELVTVGLNDPALITYDISDPAAPQPRGAVAGATLQLAWHAAVADGRAYVASRNTGLWIGDVSNAANPRTLGTVALAGRLDWVDVNGDTAYVLDTTGGVHVVNVANPAAPAALTRVGAIGTLRGLRVDGDRLYVAGRNPLLQIFDVTNPTAPTPLGTFDDGGLGNSVVVSGDIAYLATSAGLTLVDVSDPASPVGLGRHLRFHSYFDVAVAGDLVYAVGEMGLVISRATVP